jgi:hypothetical protein
MSRHLDAPERVKVDFTMNKSQFSLRDRLLVRKVLHKLGVNHYQTFRHGCVDHVATAQDWCFSFLSEIKSNITSKRADYFIYVAGGLECILLNKKIDSMAESLVGKISNEEFDKRVKAITYLCKYYKKALELGIFKRQA